MSAFPLMVIVGVIGTIVLLAAVGVFVWLFWRSGSERSQRH